MKNLALILFNVYEKIVSLFLAPVFYKEQKFPLKRMNERPVEFAFAFRCIAEYYPAALLDVGTGTTAFPHLVANCGIRTIAIDKVTGYWKFLMANRHYPVKKDDITHPALKEKFSMITCISVLEHIPAHREAVQGMFSVLADGGHIVLSFPYSEKNYIADVYRHPEAGYGRDHPFIGQVYSREQVNEWLADNNAMIVTQLYYQAFTGEFWTMGQPIYPIRETSQDSPHHLTCLLLKRK